VTFQGDGFVKPAVARFDLPDASTDGGLVLFKALDTQLGLTARRPPVSTTPGNRARSSTRRSSCCGNVSSGCVAATPTATTPPGWSTTRSTS
jgi:hypothetical protein